MLPGSAVAYPRLAAPVEAIGARYPFGALVPILVPAALESGGALRIHFSKGEGARKFSSVLRVLIIRGTNVDLISSALV